eukprot:4315839-Prymnesium_polylepis.1
MPRLPSEQRAADALGSRTSVVTASECESDPVRDSAVVSRDVRDVLARRGTDHRAPSAAAGRTASA